MEYHSVESMIEAMHAAGAAVGVYAYPEDYMINFHVNVEVKADGSALKVEAESNNLNAAVSEAFMRFRRITSAVPDFNPNRAIEHQSVTEAINDEIPF